MQWALKQGNILDEAADVLICSANVSLNLTGGVGGAILVQFGDAMQKELRAYLEEKGVKAVPAGTVVITSSCGTPFRHVIHAVGVDPFYDSSPELIESTVGNALAAAAELGARSVALTAIATGYGHLTMEEFADGIRPILGRPFGDIERVAVCVLDEGNYEDLGRALPELMSP
jgi:O-acetyl-ADP-ribose deacetylase (regulator of RNase III)